MSIDFESLASRLLLQCPDILFKWFPAGKLNGQEFQIGDIVGNAGKSLSINIKTGRWADFSSDEKGGDLVALYAAMKRITQAEAARELGAEETESPRPENKPIAPKPEISAILPTPTYIKHPKHGAPSETWAYHNENGQIIGYDCRFETPEGKQVLPYTQSAGKWAWKGFTEPRPLYGLDQLKLRPDAPVLVVEGCKCASAASDAIRGMVSVTWCGGSKAVKKTDWTPLAGRRIAVWPDADAVGIEAATWIAGTLHDLGCSIRMVDVSGRPEGWDVADAVKEGVDALEWAKSRTSNWEPPKPEPIKEPEPPEYDMDLVFANNAAPQEDNDGSAFFTVLGYQGNTFYFYSHMGEQVVDISRSALGSPAALLQIAPLDWWERQNYCGENGNLKTTPAANMLIERSYRAGLFDSNNCRGRGAWDDEGTPVLHMGDKLVVGGKPIQLRDHKSKYMYEKRLSMQIDYGQPMGGKEAYKLLEICRLIRWEDKISGELLAGWIVIAPICGALKHRPHIYILGPATSGKSWVVEEVIEGVLGKTGFKTSSKSTAAGIRQALKSDALPVIFDEAEAEEMADRIRLQEIFDMARAAFNGDSGAVHKGTADQSGKAYLIRSCFAFASINMSMQRHADETRTTILKIKQPSRDAKMEADKFSVLQRLATETITPEWRGGLLARTVSLIPAIKKNAEIFAEEAALYFGSRRQGDQLGAILAGLYSLHRSDIIDRETAKRFIQERDWPQQKETSDDSSHTRLWKFLQEGEARVDTHRGAKTRTIAELIDVVKGTFDDDVSISVAQKELSRKGFRVEDGFVFVSNTNSWIKDRLSKTEWPGKWAHTLKCIIGARSGDIKRFITTDRCIGVPMDGDQKPHELGD